MEKPGTKSTARWRFRRENKTTARHAALKRASTAGKLAALKLQLAALLSAF